MLRLFNRFRKPPEQDSWSASAYLYEARIIVHANNRTYNNFGWNSEPVASISCDSSRSEIGRLIRSTVPASHWDATSPDPLGSDNPVLQAAGVRSWTNLERKALLILFELQDGTITIIPNRATLRGEGKGWIGLNDKTHFPDECTDTELGDAALKAFEMCLPWRPAR